MKAIPGFPGYFATEDGRIWSEPKGSNICGCFLSPGVGGDGYYFVTLCKKGKKYPRKIHRLVLETFIGSRPPRMECCHNNGIKIDNQLENLRWDTHSNNIKDSVKHGTFVNNSGEKHGMAKLTEQDIRMIIYMWRTKEFTQREIAKIYGVTRTNIYYIVNKKSWKHIWR